MPKPYTKRLLREYKTMKLVSTCARGAHLRGGGGARLGALPLASNALDLALFAAAPAPTNTRGNRP